MVTYVSLFSSAGVGCFGLKKLGFKCVATNELLEKRLNIQRINKKCSDPNGYVQGSITDKAIQEQITNLVIESREREGDLDLVIATPPCQGMSVANHKKNEGDNARNSLVVESVKMVQDLQPKAFVFENVRSFLKTSCLDNGEVKSINNMIDSRLSKDYVIHKKVMNFKNYGVNSSRTRTIVIGTHRRIKALNPILMFPVATESNSLFDTIGHLAPLGEMGEVDKNDVLHYFREYDKRMLPWIEATAPNSSAFDNDLPELRPHSVINGTMVPNKNLNADKYKRQDWQKVAPCVHTRNDILSSQNTVHPVDDRVFSIRELMLMMNIPEDFKWFTNSLASVNQMSSSEKRKFIRQYDLVIRHSIGEAVPTPIFFNIGKSYEKLLKINEDLQPWSCVNADSLRKKVLKLRPKIFIDSKNLLLKNYVKILFSEEIIQGKLKITSYDQCNIILGEHQALDVDLSLGKFSFVPKHQQAKLIF